MVVRVLLTRHSRCHCLYARECRETEIESHSPHLQSQLKTPGERALQNLYFSVPRIFTSHGRVSITGLRIFMHPPRIFVPTRTFFRATVNTGEKILFNLSFVVVGYKNISRGNSIERK